LTAVQTVDRYMELTGAMMRDPWNTDFLTLGQVVANPAYQDFIDSIHEQQAFDRKIEGGPLTPVSRNVGAETTVDGRQEIVVRQCQQDAPDAKGYQGGVEVDIGSPRNEYEYVVQQVEADAGWRIVLVTRVSTSC
jgi:hypothetical protein